MRPTALLLALSGLASCGPTQRSVAPPTEPSGTAARTSEERADPWSDCYQGMDYVGNPHTDIARVTKVCGPLGGMHPVTEVTIAEQRETDAADRYTFYVPKAGRCYRVFATGERGILDLDMALRGPEGDEVIADLTHDAQPVLPPTGPVCFTDPGLYMLEVSVFRGSGRYAVQVWAGDSRSP